MARRVLCSEAGSVGEPAALTAAAERVSAGLDGRLTALFGATGYRAILDRALRLARAEVPGLGLVTVDDQAEGVLLGLAAFAAAQSDDPAKVAAGLTAMFAHLFELLVTFIGEPLTARLLREIWPGLADPARGLEEQP